jgi:molecular chaperone GrpE (heat shock protein)
MFSGWPGRGRHLLQEVQLRTWYKSEFQQALLLDGERFKQRLEAFMKPLTKNFDKANSWLDANRSNIIEITLRLWSYLRSLQGRLVMIKPVVGYSFDPKLHEAYDQEGVQLDPGRRAERKILWILCRGFQYEEDDDIVGTHVFIVKARIIVE